MVGVTRDMLKPFRKQMKARCGGRAVKVQKLKDPIVQLTYLLKFVTYHRPGRQVGKKRATAIPLPDAAFHELAAWWADTNCRDFLFLFGAREIAGCFVPTHLTNSARRAG